MNSYRMIKKASCVLLFLFIAFNSQAQQPTYVGIPSGVMNYYAAAQNNSQWCWAASIQMVLNGYGVNINQEQIVARSYGSDPYGNLPNWPGSYQIIHRNLNNWGLDNYGYRYQVSAVFGQGAPRPDQLINELANGRPVIIGYTTGGSVGHAVVVTAASFVPTPNGPMIQTIIVRDPFPTQANIQNNGRIEYPAAALAGNIQGYWFVRVNN